MAGTTDSDSLTAGTARKILRLLDALRQSQAGSVIYRQVERMLDEIVVTNNDAQLAYANVAAALLDAYSDHLDKGSPLQVQIKMLRTRLQPPLCVSDLQALRQYVDAYSEQIGELQDFNQAMFVDAVRPLLGAFGFEDTSPAVPGTPSTVTGDTQLADHTAAPVTSEPLSKESIVDTAEHAVTEPEIAAHPLDRVIGQPTLRREESLDVDADDDEAEWQASQLSRSQQLDARRRDIQELQAGLAQQVLDTIAQNEEFGVLLEVVLNELRQVDETSELENLRWTLIREIEKLMSGHHELADKLDSTHHYLQVVESDSRQLTDELTRVRLLSLTDELTGLPNRRAFLRRLEDEVARVQRYGFPLSLALMDLDKFKEINDQYGHAGGDEVLRVYSKNILSIFRHHDLVARYGGEEFAVLLPNTESEGALRALNKVKNRCAETRWQINGSSVVSVPTFSAGLALYKPGETSTAFIERVDKALYRAKRLGRNRTEMDMTYQADAERTSTQKNREPN